MRKIIFIALLAILSKSTINAQVLRQNGFNLANSTVNVSNIIVTSSASFNYLIASSATVSNYFNVGASSSIFQVTSTGLVGASSQAVVAYTSANAQDVPHNTEQLIYFGTKVIDNKNMFNGASSATFTAPIDGFYAAYCQGDFTGPNAANQLRLRLLKNAATEVGIKISSGSQAQDGVFQVVTLTQLATNDTIGCYALQNSGSKNTMCSSFTCKFGMAKLW